MFFSSNVRVLLNDFILFGHISESMPDRVGFVGESSSRGLHTNFYDPGRDSFVTSPETIRNQNLVNVIPLEYSRDEHVFLVSSLLPNKLFKNSIYGTSSGEVLLPQSTASPFLVTNPENMRPLIGIQIQSKLKFYSWEGKQLVEAGKHEISNTIKPFGSCSFIDLSGDLKPNLALHTDQNDGNYIEIHDFTATSKALLQKLPVPKTTGPFLYYDMLNRACYDLVYISNVNSSYYLNVHFNQHAPDLNQGGKHLWEYFENYSSKHPIYNIEPDVKTNILSVLQGTPVLTDKNGMPAGLFIADLQSNGEAHLIIIMDEFGVHRARCIQIIEDGGLKLSPYDNIVGEYQDVLSVSVSDVYGRGKEDLIINYMKEGVPTLIYHKINFPVQNSKLSALTVCESVRDRTAYLPGVTYLLHYDGGEKWKKASQFSSTSYLSYQQQGSFIGLGPTNFFINFVMGKTNGGMVKYNSRIISDVIVPNTSIVLIASPSDKWRVRNYFLLSRYYVVAMGLFMLIAGTMFILFYLTIKEKYMGRRKPCDKHFSKVVFPAL